MKLIMLLLLLLCPGLAHADVATSTDFDFENVFLPQGTYVQTETSYKSHDISIEIEARRVEGSDVYVADIYVRSIENIQRAFGGGAWDAKTQKVRILAADSNAVLAMTGDSGQYFTSGLVVGNGKAWRTTSNKKRDLCVIYRSGEMATYAAPVDYGQLDVESIWHTFLFGPALLDAQGRAMTEFNSTVEPANPRSAIGYYEPGHYCFVQVDGRRTKSAVEVGKTNAGLTLAQLSALMESLGCTAAYNLDGGQSSMLWFDGAILSTPYRGGRNVGDIVLIREVD